ncbi:MAG: hypothetical protein IJN64_06225 [Lachnospiraceae bacterium]|nr:hypothetical protein [Lachnospiraceae bacterium]
MDRKYRVLVLPENNWERININEGIQYDIPFTPISLENCKRYKGNDNKNDG